jgi:hypothetical protein
MARDRIPVSSIIQQLAVPGVFVGYHLASISLIGDSSHANSVTRTFSQTIWIENNGIFAERVLAATSHSLGIEVTGTSVGRGIAVARGAKVHITLRYRVTDCRHASGAFLPAVTLRLDRWWGTKSVTLQDQGSQYPGVRTACGRPAH